MSNCRFARVAILIVSVQLALMLFGQGTAAAIGPYIVTDLGDLAGPNSTVDVDAINSQGQVVGYATDGVIFHAFLWQPTTPNGATGTMIPLDASPGDEIQDSFAEDINDMGQIVGSYGPGGVHAFLWQPSGPNATTGTPKDLGLLPGEEFAYANAINNYGQIVGHSGTEEYHGYWWQPATPNSDTGVMQSLDEHVSNINSFGQIVGTRIGPLDGGLLWQPNSVNGPIGSLHPIGVIDFARAINDAGVVVGSQLGSNYSGRWVPTTPNGTTGTTTELGALPGVNGSLALAINAAGHVVGSSGADAVLWDSENRVFNLNDLLDPVTGAGWDVQEARDINNKGQIVGLGFFNGDRRAVLLTPIPEPSSLALVVVSIVCFVRGRRLLSSRGK